MSDTADLLLSTLLSLQDGRRADVERELVRTARAAALGDLAADVGHDMANPLFAILGLADLLLMDAVPGSQDEEHLLLVRQSGLELKDTLRALLDFARTPGDEPYAALDDASRAAVRLIRHGRAKQLDVVELYPSEPLVVHCPSGALAQATLHLLSGARAAAGDTGRIDVEVAPTAHGAMLRVAPAPSTGLGLVAAARIAADNGGSLGRDGGAATLELPIWVTS